MTCDESGGGRRRGGVSEQCGVVKGGGLVVFDEDGFGAEGGGEGAELGAGELEKTRRRGGAGPALEQGERGKNFRVGRRGKIGVHLERDRVAGGGGGEVGREVDAKHVAERSEAGNKWNATQL